jgi:NFU1 iron-sulfur cluster scaffold homolog, mitochondrial
MPKIADIEATPNPNAYRFTLKERITAGAPRSFSSVEAASGDSLASKLFALDGVVNVYYVDAWITVTQDGSRTWPSFLKELAEPIREASAAPSIEEEFADVSENDKDIIGTDDDRFEPIRLLLNERVRPALMSDGGDLKIVSLIENTLTVRYFGACGSCPSSLSGTLNAIQSLVSSIDPDITVVVV